MAVWGDFLIEFPSYFQELARRNPYSVEQGFFSRGTGNYQDGSGNWGHAAFVNLGHGRAKRTRFARPSC
jgi:hypothetical protein